MLRAMIRNVVMVQLAAGADAEHNRLRGLLAPMTERIARCQFELPDA
jgi:hypothetical protein